MAGRTSGPGRGPGAGFPGVGGHTGPRAAVAPTVAGGGAIVYTRVASPRPARCAMPERDPRPVDRRRFLGAATASAAALAAAPSR